MKSKGLRWLLFALLATGIALAILYRDHLDAATLQLWVQQAGAAAPLLFMAIYAIGAMIFLPGSVLTLEPRHDQGDCHAALAMTGLLGPRKIQNIQILRRIVVQI